MSDVDETSSNTTSSNYNAFGNQKFLLSNKMFQNDYKAKELRQLPPMHSTKLKPKKLTNDIIQQLQTPANSNNRKIFMLNSRNLSHKEEIKERYDEDGIDQTQDIKGKIYLNQLRMIDYEKSKEPQKNGDSNYQKDNTLRLNLQKKPIMYELDYTNKYNYFYF